MLLPTPPVIVSLLSTPKPFADDTPDLDIRGATLAEFCERVSKLLHITITVEPEIRNRRVVACCSNVPATKALAHLVDALRFTMRETESGYAIFRTEEQKKKELNDEKASSARFKALLQDGEQGLRVKVSEAMPSPALSFATFLRGFSSEQFDSMVYLAQLPMGMLYADSHRNLEQRLLFLRPFDTLSPPDQKTIKALLERGGYAFRGEVGPPDDLTHSSIGVIAAFGHVGLGIIGPDGKDIWLDPTNHLGAATLISGQNADPCDYDPLLAEEREKGQLVRGLTAQWRTKTVRFAPLDKTRYLPNILRDIEQKTGLAFFGPSYLHTEYPTLPLDGLKEGEDIPLPDALLAICRAYGQRMEMRDGVIHVSTLTPGLDRRLEPPRSLLLLIANRNLAKDPTLTLEEFTALCALSPMQWLMLPRGITTSRWVYTLSSQFQDHYLAANFYAELSDEERAQAMTAEGLDIGKLSRNQKRMGILVSEIGRTAPKGDEPTQPLHFYVQVIKRQPDPAGTTPQVEAIQKVIFTFVSRSGTVHRAELSF